MRPVTHSGAMHLTFLGGANTVTGSRFLLETGRAKVLIDCGMFQGSPNEVVRNRVPVGFGASELDAILVTHAHLDHCGYLPVVVKAGSSPPSSSYVDRFIAKQLDSKRQPNHPIEVSENAPVAL